MEVGSIAENTKNGILGKKWTNLSLRIRYEVCIKLMDGVLAFLPQTSMSSQLVLVDYRSLLTPLFLIAIVKISYLFSKLENIKLFADITKMKYKLLSKSHTKFL